MSFYSLKIAGVFKTLEKKQGVPHIIDDSIS